MAFPQEQLPAEGPPAPAPEEATPAPAPAPVVESKYWAAAPKEKIGSEIAAQVSSYYMTMESSGLFGLYRNSHAHVYSLGSTGHEGSKLVEFGDDGEKLGIRSNQLRSLLRFMLNSAVAKRPAIVPKAINASSKAMAQVPTAKRLLQYYHKTKRLEKELTGCALRSLVYGKAYLWQAWDPSEADGGDLVYQACDPMDVAIDLEQKAGKHSWYCISRQRNRYDIAAQYGNTQELYDEIVGTDKDCLSKEVLEAIGFGLQAAKSAHDKESDTIYERHFMHKKTPALPKGRYVIMIGEDRVLFDGPLPYKSIPVHEMVPEEFLKAGSVGYSSIWDLIGMQDAYDGLMSTCISNFDAYGHNDMLLPDGVELSVEYVRDGLNAIRYPMGEANKPSMLEKFSIPEEVFKLAEWLRKDMETNSGVNSVARGDPQSSLQTGPALALVQAQAIEFLSAFVGSFVQLLEESGTGTIHILQEYCPQERIAEIGGVSDPDGVVAFSDPGLDMIDRLEFESGPVLADTLAGKADLANAFMEQGLITNVNQYMEFLSTGRLEVLTDPGRKASMQVNAENEMLMTGPATQARPPQPGMEMLPPEQTVAECPVVMTDHPIEHIMGHTTVLNSPENRKNPQVIAAVTAHILEHIKVWRETPPDVLMLLDYPLPNVPNGEAPTPDGEDAPEGDEEGGPPKKKSEKSKAKAKEEGGAQPVGGGNSPRLPKAPETDKLGRPTK